MSKRDATRTIEQMAQEIQNLGPDDTCPICSDTFLIPCPDHKARTDADGWCLTCDSPQDTPQPISCPCQNL